MKISRRALFIFSLVLIGGSIFFLIATISLFYIDMNRFKKADAFSAIDQRLQNAFSTINAFPGSAGKDILFLLNLSSVQNLHMAGSRVISSEARNDFKKFLANNNIYKDLLFYKKNFKCAMRVSSDGRYNNDLCATLPPALADILAKSASLSLGEVYISPLLSYKSIFGGNNDAPVIIYISPVNYDCNIVSVVDANYFLEEIRRLKRDGEITYLLDRDGSYLANPDKEKEKPLGGSDNFYRDFPGVPAGALDDAEMRRFESDDGSVFTFWRIYPTASNFALYEGAKSMYGEDRAADHYWIMATVSKNIIINWWQNISYISALIAIIVSYLFMVVILYFSQHE